MLSPAALDQRPLGIYLHIPFCVRKCLYCDFLSMAATDEVIERYVQALCRQIKKEAPIYGAYRVNTIFMGGGTPSLLSGDQLQQILDTVRKYFVVEADAEITMESNPGTLTKEKLAAYRRAGVNRLSMGLQSTEDHLLRALGRIHTWQEFCENFHAARAAGFDNINIDLMSALPGQICADWMETLRKVAALEPEHISAYSLIIEEGTPFYDRYGEEAIPGGYPALPDEDEERLMYARTEEFLKEKGYHRYEISNYAREGRECIHNVGNWNRVEYAGFGIGAASLIQNRRFQVIADLHTYLQELEEKEGAWDSLHEEALELDEAAQMEEFMFLGLRLTEGISVVRFQACFGREITAVYGRILDELEQQELLVFDRIRQQIRLTPRGVDVSNYVLAQFLLEE